MMFSRWQLGQVEQQAYAARTAADVDLLESRAMLAADINVLLSGPNTVVTNGQIIDLAPVNESQVGTAAATVNFNVQNLGDADLTIAFSQSGGPGFVVTQSTFGTLMVPNQNALLSIQTPAGTPVGEYAATFTFTTNDPDESPLSFTLRRAVTPAFPEIDVFDGGTPVPSGTSVSFGVATTGTSVVKAIEVRNTGSKTLNVAGTQFTPAGAPGFTILNPGPFSVAPGASAFVQLRLDALEANNYFGTLRIFSDDSNESTYNINVSGIVQRGDPPEIRVIEGGHDIPDGQFLSSFGSTHVGTSVIKTYTVRNVGRNPLILQPVVAPAGYTVINNFTANQVLGSLQSISFQVQLDAAAPGRYSGLLLIPNNDSDENPFDLTVDGLVTPATVTILDDGDQGFTSTGGTPGIGWRNAQNINPSVLSDFKYLFRGEPNGIASWDFPGLVNGTYQVSASWIAHPDRAKDAPYVIRDGLPGTVVASVQVDQSAPPNSFFAGPVGWEILGTVTITSGRLVVQLTNAGAGSVVADAIRLDRILTPEIRVFDGVNELTDGASITSLGTTTVGQPVTKTFAIQNAGTSNLVLDPVTVLPAGYSVVTNLVAGQVLAPGQIASFTLRLDANLSGNYAGVVAFGNSDADENEFSFYLDSNVLPAAANDVRVIDDGDAGFSLVGAWNNAPFVGYQSDLKYAFSDGVSAIASWDFQNLQPGRYRVSATWNVHPNRATNAPYVIRDGLPGAILGLAALNQKQPPNDFTSNGVSYEDVATVNLTSTRLIVQLTNGGDGVSIADAIRIERIGGLPLAPASTPSDSKSTAAASAASVPLALPKKSSAASAVTAGASTATAGRSSASIATATPSAADLDAVLADDALASGLSA